MRTCGTASATATESKSYREYYGFRRRVSASDSETRSSAMPRPEVERSVFRPIELRFDPTTDVVRPFDLRQPLVEHELGDTRRGRHFRFQDVGLAREQHPLRAQARVDLVRTRLCGNDEALVRD